MTRWRFVGACCDGERFELIPGHNIWDHDWTTMYRDPPPPPTGNAFDDMRASYVTATVKDPHYGNEREFRVHEVVLSNRTIRFAADEFSNTIWGFYLPEESQT